MEYSKRERKEIEEAYNVILEDMNDLWQSIDKADFNLYVGLDEIGYIFPKYPKIGWRLCFDKSGIYLNCETAYHNYKIYLQKNSVVGPPKKKLRHPEAGALLVQNYPEIREKIVEKIELVSYNKQLEQEDHDKEMDKIRKVRDLYAKEIDVEVINPNGINQLNIEIKEENGKNIGTLYVGPFTINFLTNSKINLINKKEQPKVKKK